MGSEEQRKRTTWRYRSCSEQRGNDQAIEGDGKVREVGAGKRIDHAVKFALASETENLKGTKRQSKGYFKSVFAPEKRRMAA